MTIRREELEALRAEAARLRESELMYRLSSELDGRLVWTADPQGRVTEVSPLFARLAGSDGAPCLNRRLEDLIHPGDLPRVLALWETARADGSPFEAEFRITLADGRLRLVRSRAVPLRDDQGRVQRWYGSIEDISEERAADQARNVAEARYQLAVRATNDAVWDLDLVADRITWSDNSAAMFGGPPSPDWQTPNDWWVDRVHPEDRRRVVTGFHAAIEEGDSHWAATYRFRREDGSYADIFDRGFILRLEDGNAIRAVGAMADLTERNRAEAELRRMEAELIHVSRLSAMGAMASTLAHELNQPLAAISNYVSGARRVAARTPDLPSDLVEALDLAASGAQRAGEIVRRLRELVSRRPVTVAPQEVSRLIEEAAVVALVDAKRHGIRHRVEVDADAEWVLVDRIQIEQVLINLVRNSIEAMEGPGRREILISARRTGHLVEIGVADTGPGISEEHFDSLFSHFMTTKSEGVGIGLPISRTIVESHRGKIWAENRPEGGALFRFTVPAADTFNR